MEATTIKELDTQLEEEEVTISTAVAEEVTMVLGHTFKMILKGTIRDMVTSEDVEGEEDIAVLDQISTMIMKATTKKHPNMVSFKIFKDYLMNL